MRPLPAAQATAVSLHALLPRPEPTTRDEKLVVDAIRALHRWARPDRRPVPARLRLRGLPPVRIRVRPPRSESTLVVKRGARRRVRSRRVREAESVELAVSQAGEQLSPAGTPGREGEKVAKGGFRRSSSSRGSQVVNLSDLTTEPPEGWPKLSDPQTPSPTLELRTAVPESEIDTRQDGEVLATPVRRVSKRRRRLRSLASQSSALDSESADIGSREDSPKDHAVPASPGRRVTKRRRASSETSGQPGQIDAGATNTSQGSTKGGDSPEHSTSVKRSEKDDDGHKKSVDVRKKCAKQKKRTLQKRKRSTSTDQSVEQPSINGYAKKPFAELNRVAKALSLSCAEESPVREMSTKVANSDCDAESPPTSVAQKIRERNTDTQSRKSDDPAHSLGSVVVGSASYDGGSVDMGYDRARGELDDGASRPRSSVWNGTSDEAIEEPLTGDHSAFPFDPIEETEKLAQTGLHTPINSSHQPDSHPRDSVPSATPHAAKKGSHGDARSGPNEIITAASLRKGPGRPVAPREPTKSSVTPLLHHPENHGDTLSLPVSSQIETRKTPVVNQAFPYRRLPAGISPVSVEGLAARDERRVQEAQSQVKSNCPSEASIGEMVVCIVGFPNETESELAHEIVMRLGGEIVTDFNGAQPECVVAPVDPKTEEALSQEMVIHLALASRVPVIGLSWLIQCFKSGCWVDFDGFETLSSRRKPRAGVFEGVAATFEDPFFRKNARKQKREYRDSVNKLIVLAGGVVIDKATVTEVTQNDNRFRLHVQIAYDFENDSLNTAPQEPPAGRIQTRVVNKSWLFACLFSGECPPP